MRNTGTCCVCYCTESSPFFEYVEITGAVDQYYESTLDLVDIVILRLSKSIGA